MSNPSALLRQSLLPLALITPFICATFGAVAWTTTASSAFGLVATTPTRPRSSAFAEIAKPTYTASPTSTALPTNTPKSIYAEIVADTPTPAYSAPPNASQVDNPAAATSGYVGNKYILVDISEQHLYVYEGDTLVYSFVSSTGMNNATRIGSFSVLEKIPNAYGATWNIWMPNWLGIYWSGNLQNGIHALPILPNGSQLWEGYLGVPISYGCVVLGADEAQLLYDWAEIGVPVKIQW